MRDIIRKDYDKSVFIPLRASEQQNLKGKLCYEGYQEVFMGSNAILFPLDKQSEAIKLNWGDQGMGTDNRPYVDEEKGYLRAGTFEHYDGLKGEHLVLKQHHDDSDERPDWHLSEDLVLALGLLRKDDVWVCPKENYLEVARLIRNHEGNPVRLDFRVEHLKDYLCARKSGVLLFTFHQRREIVANCKDIGCEENWNKEEKKDNCRWMGRCYAIHEGSCSPYGAQTAVFHAGRKDVDYKEDVPVYGFPTDGDMKTESRTFGDKGRKLYFVSGEVWKTDWIKPAEKSPRVRHDQIESVIPFIIDNEGKSLCGDDLKAGGRYLWFKPTLVNALLGFQNSHLGWYTEDTGNLGLTGRTVHFGVNSEGFINVYAKDIALLPEIDKKIWISHNVTPEGGVSKELLQSQQEAVPASTTSPETRLIEGIKLLDEAFNDKFGSRLFRTHDSENEILRNIHRFQSTSEDGVFILAKELTRFVIERLDYKILESLTSTLDSKTGSLKRLEQILSDCRLRGRKILSPFAGIYELRKADAHLPSKEYQEALKLLELDSHDRKNLVDLGKKMIYKIAERCYMMAKLISESH